MFTLITTILIASLIGSLHCAGMCGPFVAFCVGAERQNVLKHSLIQGAYHGGRLVSYALLGIVAGAVGSVIDFGGRAIGFQRTAMMLAGGFMALVGIIMLLRFAGMRIKKVPVPQFLQRWFVRGQAFAQKRHPVARALVIGLFSILLPCGWLYLYVFAAAGTGSPWMGLAAMIAFWAGTVPVLAAVGVGVQALFGPLRRHLPVAVAIAMVLFGGIVLVRGYGVSTAEAGTKSGASEDRSVDEALRRREGVEEAELPCCDPPG
ncbi:MAG: sulfite exporter TauE/SafE family protein [Phycisphaerales bacterium JB038]